MIINKNDISNLILPKIQMEFNFNEFIFSLTDLQYKQFYFF